MSEAGPARILVVDDEAFNRDVLVQEIEDLGHAVITAEDGISALELLARDPVDLVLLDIMMPGMTGFEVLSRLADDEHLWEIPVIVISALHDIDAVARGIELGALDYLPKPFEPRILEARIGASLERARWASQERRYLEEIERQRQRADEVLQALLPQEAVSELTSTGAVEPRFHAGVAVMFLDIAGFTPLTLATPLPDVIAGLTRFVDLAERVVEEQGLEKIKTVGDAVIVTGDLLRPHPDPVAACAACAEALVAGMAEIQPGWRLRGGVSFGPVVSGVIGRKRFGFDVWGETVNAAARLSGLPGTDALYFDAAAYARLDREAVSIGTQPLKGLGDVEVRRLDLGRAAGGQTLASG